MGSALVFGGIVAAVAGLCFAVGLSKFGGWSEYHDATTKDKAVGIGFMILAAVLSIAGVAITVMMVIV